ncbi:oligopeptide transport system ATP-binding protein [Neobacillus niacini]|jgi:oligopeptide transport system ATP-binding protein|uniref:ABC transporter ATP-binding protein n=1 Tax=Neobacillus driksii TaxID=3035913 RepID=UPI00278B37AE|nr:dipeptide ABC transporter ATP-binding protein [Neobacillus niacini]MDQ0971873.1 oligopeptide transport system ATP-binding protein [Neobacillus niacini]
MSNVTVEKREPLITVNGLKTYYPIKKGILSRTVGHVKAVDGVSFSIFEGETLGLVGESGCGKSTIGRSIVRLENPTEGKIIFQGDDITGLSNKQMSDYRSNLQIIFQDPFSSLNPRKRIKDIIAEPLKVHQIVQQKDIQKRVDELLDMVGLPKHYKNRYPHEFSGGQRQRIGIARALSLNPKLIVCDEPVSALDVSIQAQVLNLLSDLQKELNLTYLFIAHGLGAVKYISDRIAVMYLGKVVEIAKTEDIFKNPKHPYSLALLNAYPVPNPNLRNKERIVIQGDVPSPANPPKGCRFHTRCPIAMDICRQQVPELKGTDHAVACFAVN